jgi:hypothetical protein
MKAATKAAGTLAATTELAIAGRRFAAAATAFHGRASTLGKPLLRLQAGNHFGLERLAGVGLDVKDAAAIAELGKRHGQPSRPARPVRPMRWV